MTKRKKRFESSIQSNLVNDVIFKVHFYHICESIREVSLFSCILRQVCNKTRRKVWGKKVSLFVEFFLIVSTHSELCAKTFQQGCPVYNQNVHWNILKKVFVQRTKLFLKVSSNFHQKKYRILAIIFETVVETACFGYRRLLWEENNFWWIFLILIFALPKKWFRT